MKKIFWIFLLSGIAIFTAHIREIMRSDAAALPENALITGEFVDVTAQDNLAAVAMVLGPFRGLISAAIWWRALEEEGKSNYDEVLQLTSWLSCLQPQNGFVWSYQARNLAFNIAFTRHDPAVRWQWVLSGLRLLLNDGIRYAPKSEVVRSEIASILLAKCAGTSEDFAVPFYKKAFASEMCRYLRKGDRAELEMMQTVDQSADSFRRDQRVHEFLNAAAEKYNLDLLSSAVYSDSMTALTLQHSGIFDRQENVHALQLIDQWHGVQEFKKNWKTDVTRMLYIDSEYGPFDWRLPMGYVIYWRANLPFSEFLKQNSFYRPEIRLAMRLAFEEGRLLGNPETMPFMVTSDWRIIDKFRTYIHALPNTDTDFLSDLYRKNFLSRAAAILYVNNQTEKARTIYHDCQLQASTDAADFDTFISESMALLFQTTLAQRSRRGLIEAALLQAEIARGTGDDEMTVGYSRIAVMIWEQNQKEFHDAPDLQLPPLSQLKQFAAKRAESILQTH